MIEKLTKGRALSSGFTLIELLLTLFVMAMLSAIVIPTVGNLVANMEARAFVLQLEADIAFAQKRATATGQPVRFYVSRSTGLYQISERKGVLRHTVKTVYLPKTMSFSDGLDITFRPETTFSGQSNGGTIYIKHKDRKYADVVISLLSSRTRVEWHD